MNNERKRRRGRKTGVEKFYYGLTHQSGAPSYCADRHDRETDGGSGPLRDRVAKIAPHEHAPSLPESMKRGSSPSMESSTIGAELNSGGSVTGHARAPGLPGTATQANMVDRRGWACKDVRQVWPTCGCRVSIGCGGVNASARLTGVGCFSFKQAMI
jgi:hypothetical protein